MTALVLAAGLLFVGALLVLAISSAVADVVDYYRGGGS